MKKISGKKIAIIAVALTTCVAIGIVAFILSRGDKLVQTPTTSTNAVESDVNSDSTSDVSSDSTSDKDEVVAEPKIVKEFELGPDIAGNKYNVKVYLICDESDIFSNVTFISINGGKEQEVADDNGVSGRLCDVISMIDEDGKPVIIVNMDYMSDDYFFVAYTIENDQLVRCGSDCALITEAKADRTLTAKYRIDFFGYWLAGRTVKLTNDNKVQLQEGEYSLLSDDGLLLSNEERKLTAKEDIKVSFADKNGKYQSATLKKGSVISLYATDGESYVLFTTNDGKKGKIEASFKDGSTLINGKNDFDLFDGIFYAD